MKAPTPYLEKVFLVAVPYIFPLIGLACIVEPYIMTDYAPTLLGGLMILGGLYSHLEAIRHHSYRDLTNIDMGISLLMLIVGMIIFIREDMAILLMGYVWGLMGMYKGARLLDQSLYYALKKEPTLIRLFWGVTNLALGILLVLDPAENFAHHVMLLGFELIAYSAQQLTVVKGWTMAWNRYLEKRRARASELSLPGQDDKNEREESEAHGH